MQAQPCRGEYFHAPLLLEAQWSCSAGRAHTAFSCWVWSGELGRVPARQRADTAPAAAAQLDAMELKQLRSGGVLTQLLAQLGEKYEPERLAAALKERELEMAMRAAGVVASFGTWIARVTAVRACTFLPSPASLLHTKHWVPQGSVALCCLT